jgi:hypothetical protein
VKIKVVRTKRYYFSDIEMGELLSALFCFNISEMVAEVRRALPRCDAHLLSKKAKEAILKWARQEEKFYKEE